MWAINDSGNGAVLYLYSVEDANLRALFILNGISNVDWEDLGMHNENENGVLYIPDIGDNEAKRSVYSIYKIPEPVIAENDAKINKLNVTPEVLRYMYSNGARDAEAMAYDPVDKKITIISKREKKVFIYSTEWISSGPKRTLNPLGQLPLTNVVAADFSSDGSKFLLKTYTTIYLWIREHKNEPFCSMISRTPIEVPYQIEPQGESICFSTKGILTLSEERFRIQPILFLYPQVSERTK